MPSRFSGFMVMIWKTKNCRFESFDGKIVWPILCRWPIGNSNYLVQVFIHVTFDLTFADLYNTTAAVQTTHVETASIEDLLRTSTVQDFKIPCSRPETSGFYPRCLLTKHKSHGPRYVRDDYKTGAMGLKNQDPW